MGFDNSDTRPSVDPVSETLLVRYQPQTLTDRYPNVDDLTVIELASPYFRAPGARRAAYADYSYRYADGRAKALLAFGFERRGQQQFLVDLTHDLYARLGVQPSSAIGPLDFASTGEVLSPSTGIGWRDQVCTRAHARPPRALWRQPTTSEVAHG